MRTLLAAVDSGSLSAASRALRIPLPTVSRRIADLESHLGAQLVTRTSRKLLLTEAGEAFIQAARRILDELAEAERAARGEYLEPRGELLVTAPILFGRICITHIIHDFLAAYPKVTVRLVLSDHVFDLAEKHVDVAIRIGHLPDSEIIGKVAGYVHWILCAGEAYLAKRGEPIDPAELPDHDCIAFDGERTYASWMIGTGANARTVTIRPRLSVNTASDVVDAAVANLGIARVLSYQASQAVALGQLRPILRAYRSAPIPVNLVHQPQRVQPLKRRAFLDFLAPRLNLVLTNIEQTIGA